MKNKGTSTFSVVFLTAIVTALLCFIVFKLWSYGIVLKGDDGTTSYSGFVSAKEEQATNQTTGLATSTLRKLLNLKKLMDEEYLYEYDENDMADYMAKGMLSALKDPYAEYYNPKAFESFYTQTEGEYYGIGIYVTYDEAKKMPVIIAPLYGSPALEAGLQTLDYIEYVDDLLSTEHTYTELVDAIKGVAGTTVTIGIIRLKDDGTKERIEKDIKRERIEINPIRTATYEDSIGYIKMTSFDETSYDNFKKEYETFTSNPKIKSLIIDLRDNPGGILQVCTDITDLIVPSGKIVYTLDKSGKEDIIYSDENAIKIPLVVLVNGSSASASEVFTGAVKDYGVGTIIGTKTYGKGLVQTLKSLKDGSYIKLTTAEYFSPKGNKIDKEGITPDIVVELPEEIKSTYYLEYKDDLQLQKAVEYLKEKQ